MKGQRHCVRGGQREGWTYTPVMHIGNVEGAGVSFEMIEWV